MSRAAPTEAIRNGQGSCECGSREKSPGASPSSNETPAAAQTKSGDTTRFEAVRNSAESAASGSVDLAVADSVVPFANGGEGEARITGSKSPDITRAASPSPSSGAGNTKEGAGRTSRLSLNFAERIMIGRRNSRMSNCQSRTVPVIRASSISGSTSSCDGESEEGDTWFPIDELPGMAPLDPAQGGFKPGPTLYSASTDQLGQLESGRNELEALSSQMRRRTSVKPNEASSRSRSLFRMGRSNWSAEQKDLWARCFNIRVAVSPHLHEMLLQDRRMDDPKSRLVGASTDSITMSAGFCSGAWLAPVLAHRRLARLLKILSWLSMFFAPTHLAVWPLCELRTERKAVAVLKSLHMAVSVVYVITSFGQHWAKIMMPQHLNEGGGASKKGLDNKRKEEHSVSNYKNRQLGLDMLSLWGVMAEFFLLADKGLHHRRQASWTEALTLLLFLRGWRIFTSTGARVMGFAVQVSELFLSLFFLGHTFACVFLRLALEGHRYRQPTWADTWLFEEQWSCVDLYTSALYFCTYTLTSIGYGDLVPANAWEQLVCVVFMLGSQMIAAKIFADLTWITATHGHWKAQSHAQMMQTAAALQGLGVNPHLRERVYAYQDFIAEERRERRTQDCLRDLSRPLREELRFEVYYDLVVKAAFLQEQPTQIVRVIIGSLSDAIYLPCDVIIRRGDLGTELFFLREGHAGVFRTPEMPEWTDQEIHVLKNGAYFGEIALLTGQTRQSWVVARTYCVCSLLPKQVIDEVMTAHPACLTALVNSLKNALGLKSATSWQDLLFKIREEFRGEAYLFDFVCSGQDGEAASGVLTWNRWDVFMRRLCVPTLDSKLLWVDLDLGCKGSVPFSEFLDKIKKENSVLQAIDICDPYKMSQRPSSFEPSRIGMARPLPSTSGSTLFEKLQRSGTDTSLDSSAGRHMVPIRSRPHMPAQTSDDEALPSRVVRTRSDEVSNPGHSETPDLRGRRQRRSSTGRGPPPGSVRQSSSSQATPTLSSPRSNPAAAASAAVASLSAAAGFCERDGALALHFAARLEALAAEMRTLAAGHQAQPPSTEVVGNDIKASAADGADPAQQDGGSARGQWPSQGSSRSRSKGWGQWPSQHSQDSDRSTNKGARSHDSERSKSRGAGSDHREDGWQSRGTLK